MDDSYSQVARILKALADPTRQQIMFMLRQGEASVGDITGRLAIAQPSVSQHLRILRESGAVAARKDGQRVYYRLCSARIFDALKEFVEIFEQETGNTRR